MCDYSLHSVKTRAAEVNDVLTIRQFPSGSRGFTGETDASMAVCLLPGTELAFSKEIVSQFVFAIGPDGHVDLSKPLSGGCSGYDTAVFRQVEKETPYTHHDALELPNGQIIKLQYLTEGTTATVLQLPAAPKTKEEAEAQQRLEAVG